MCPTAAAVAPAAEDPSAPPAELGEPVAEESCEEDVAFMTPISPLAPRMWGGISIAFNAGWIFNSVCINVISKIVIVKKPRIGELGVHNKHDDEEELVTMFGKVEEDGQFSPVG